MLRVVLGNAQIFSAVVTVGLVWQLGVCRASIIAGVVTAALLAMSLALFGLRGSAPR
jgi:hypothetical protein